MRISLSLEEAKKLHKEDYDSDFIIANFTRSGQFDIPPWSLVYGISDLGSWDGNISTDGKNFVVTKHGSFSADKIKKKYSFSVDDIEKIDIGVFKTNIIFKKKMSGLTKKSSLSTYLLICSFFILLPIYIFMPSRTFSMRLGDEYKTRSDLEKILKKEINPEEYFGNTDSNLNKESLNSSEKNEEEIQESEDNLESKLEKILELKNKGLITDEEYQEKRKNLIDLV